MLTQEKNAFVLSSDDESLQELLRLIQRIDDVKAFGDLAEWDMNTQMPDGAGSIRGNQMASMQGVLHEFRTDPRIGELLNTLELRIGQHRYSDADRGLVRIARRMYDQATKLPRELVEEMARVGASSFDAWRRARERNH